MPPKKNKNKHAAAAEKTSDDVEETVVPTPAATESVSPARPIEEVSPSVSNVTLPVASEVTLASTETPVALAAESVADTFPSPADSREPASSTEVRSASPSVPVEKSAPLPKAADVIKAKEREEREQKRQEDLLARATEEAKRREVAAATSSDVVARFQIQYDTRFGQNVYVTGSAKQLGAWVPSNGIKLVWNAGNIWTGETSFPASQVGDVEYKYVIMDDTGASVWETGDNRKLSVGSKPQVTMTDAWNVRQSAPVA
eukprot:GILK01000627.1.p1 GENE.GILK01000627.1~~GILK01000627.1.p1  ORF type:complete len:281 (+),score=55.79 GILK01000627.1:70-843(+)